MPRAYRARHTTLELVRRIRALDGIARVDIIPPRRGPWFTDPTRLKVTLVPMGANPVGASTIFTLPEAREWLASEEKQNA